MKNLVWLVMLVGAAACSSRGTVSGPDSSGDDDPSVDAMAMNHVDAGVDADPNGVYGVCCEYMPNSSKVSSCVADHLPANAAHDTCVMLWCPRADAGPVGIEGCWGDNMHDAGVN